MPKKSAGLLVYRLGDRSLEVFLVHPGGPFWAKKDEGAWSMPKGEYEDGEAPLLAAKREFTEETGLAVPKGSLIALTALKLPSGKLLTAWGLAGDFDAMSIRSATFSLTWPPGSGSTQHFPEVDRGGWFKLAEAERKITRGQRPLLAELSDRLSIPFEGAAEDSA